MALRSGCRHVSSDAGTPGLKRQRQHAPASEATAHGQDDSKRLVSFLSALDAGELDTAIEALELRKQQLRWGRLPPRIVMIRHGQSEGNVDHAVYSVKGDAQLELTAHGLRQARGAGGRLRDLIGKDKVIVFVSPFERTQQTLLGLYEGGFPAEQVETTQIDPRIREKEFGNFQSAGTMAALRVEEQIVGRFYYRLPNAESCADVLDRVSSFLDALLSEGSAMETFDTCLLVTHGLTIRLMLMEMLQWSVRTFEAVFNPGNCDYVVLRKNMDKLCYELCPEESCPAQAPWSTMEVWIRLHALSPSEQTERKLQDLKALPDDVRAQPSLANTIDDLEQKRQRECSKPYTVVDYMTLPKPTGPVKTTMFGLAAILERLVEGHNLQDVGRERLLAQAGKTGLQPSDIHSIDWWGDSLSYRGKLLRHPK